MRLDLLRQFRGAPLGERALVLELPQGLRFLAGSLPARRGVLAHSLDLNKQRFERVSGQTTLRYTESRSKSRLNRMVQQNFQICTLSANL